MLIAQTMAEYGFLASVAAGLTTARDRVEMYVGSGNLKYLLVVLVVVFILMLAKRRRRA